MILTLLNVSFLVKTELENQIAEEAELNRKIAENLSKIKLPK